VTTTTESFPKLPRPVWFLAGIIVVLFIGLTDYATGEEISFSIFYLLPVAITTWFVGRRVRREYTAPIRSEPSGRRSGRPGMDLAPRAPGWDGGSKPALLPRRPGEPEPAGQIVDELPRDAAAAMPVFHRPAKGLLVQPLPFQG
jgi:hypothetical protein